MLSKFNDEQLSLVFQILDPKHWAIRFKRHTLDVDMVKEIAKEANL